MRHSFRRPPTSWRFARPLRPSGKGLITPESGKGNELASAKSRQRPHWLYDLKVVEKESLRDSKRIQLITETKPTDFSSLGDLDDHPSNSTRLESGLGWSRGNLPSKTNKVKKRITTRLTCIPSQWLSYRFELIKATLGFKLPSPALPLSTNTFGRSKTV